MEEDMLEFITIRSDRSLPDHSLQSFLVYRDCISDVTLRNVAITERNCTERSLHSALSFCGGELLRDASISF